MIARPAIGALLGLLGSAAVTLALSLWIGRPIAGAAVCSISTLSVIFGMIAGACGE